MAIAPFLFKNTLKYTANGTIDLDTDTLKAALVSSAWHIIPNRANSTAYVRGDTYKSGTHFYRCQVAGTSAGSPPTLPTAGTCVTDGTATFQDVGTSLVNGKITIPARVNSATVVIGQMYTPATPNGHWYECTSAGTLAGSAPTFQTNGTSFADGTATFKDMGTLVPRFVGLASIWADISANEVTGTGYTAGGQTLTNVTVVATPEYTIFDADNVVWASSTISALWLVIYKSGSANGLTNPLYMVQLLDDTMTSVSSVNSDFSVIWDVNGIHRQITGY